MSNNFAIMRTEKVKSVSSMANLEKHCSRAKMPKNADPNRTKLNKTYYKDTLTLTQRFAKMTAGQKIRKNAVLGVEVLMTASPEAMHNMDTLDKWVKANHEWLCTEFGKSNVCRMWLHMDETTPHIHAFVIPLDEKGKLNCRSYLGGADKLSKMQDRYAEAMKQFDLERGVKGSKAHHKSIKEFYRAIEGAEQQNLPKPTQETKKSILGEKKVSEDPIKYYDRANKIYKQQNLKLVALEEQLRKEKEHTKTISVAERMEQAQQKRELETLRQQASTYETYKMKSDAWDTLKGGLDNYPDKDRASQLKHEINSIINAQRIVQEHEATEQKQEPGRER